LESISLRYCKYAAWLVSGTNFDSGCISSIARLPFIKVIGSNSPNFLQIHKLLLVWSTLELGLGISAASLATLQPFLRMYLPRLRGSSAADWTRRSASSVKSKISQVDLKSKMSQVDLKTRVSQLDLKRRASQLDLKRRASQLDLKNRVSQLDLRARISQVDLKQARRPFSSLYRRFWRPQIAEINEKSFTPEPEPEPRRRPSLAYLKDQVSKIQNSSKQWPVPSLRSSEWSVPSLRSRQWSLPNMRARMPSFRSQEPMAEEPRQMEETRVEIEPPRRPSHTVSHEHLRHSVPPDFLESLSPRDTSSEFSRARPSLTHSRTFSLPGERDLAGYNFLPVRPSSAMGTRNDRSEMYPASWLAAEEEERQRWILQRMNWRPMTQSSLSNISEETGRRWRQ
jgi:hypothetical protein